MRNLSVRFQRQKAIGNYIVDFYCAKLSLVIELDGGEHYNEEQTKKDALRTKELEAMNLKIIRISNLDIDKNFEGVCEYINEIVTTPPSAFADTSPDKGRQYGSL